MEKRPNVKKVFIAIYQREICFLFSFFYNRLTCSGDGMVDMYVSDAYALWVCGFNSHLEHHRFFAQVMEW
jgi:hypothetical protein